MKRRPQTRKPGRRSKPVNVTQDEIDLVRKVGGPTFTPLTGGRYRCNQLRHLGRLTREQVAGVKESCGFHGTKPEEERQRVVRESVVIRTSVPKSTQAKAPLSVVATATLVAEFLAQDSQRWLESALGHRQASTVRW